MANEQNLRPSEYKLSREEAKKGGIKSGETRRRKADMRKAMEEMLFSEFTDKKTGNKLTGLEMITASMVKIAADPRNKSAVSAYRAIAEITGQTEAVKTDEVAEDAREAIANLLNDATERQRKRNKDID